VNTFGPDCERAHDIVDQQVIAYLPEETTKTVIMTTWLDERSIEKALWDFLYVGYPATGYWESCASWLAVSIGRPDWAEEISNWLADPAALSAWVLGADDEADED
jgi:hypothetical protein